MSELAIMNGEGDTRIMWDSSRPAEVETARAAFDEARERGMVAYSVTAAGDRDEIISEFDAEAEKIIMAPALRGG